MCCIGLVTRFNHRLREAKMDDHDAYARLDWRIAGDSQSRCSQDCCLYGERPRMGRDNDLCVAPSIRDARAHKARHYGTSQMDWDNHLEQRPRHSRLFVSCGHPSSGCTYHGVCRTSGSPVHGDLCHTSDSWHRLYRGDRRGWHRFCFLPISHSLSSRNAYSASMHACRLACRILHRKWLHRDACLQKHSVCSSSVIVRRGMSHMVAHSVCRCG